MMKSWPKRKEKSCQATNALRQSKANRFAAGGGSRSTSVEEGLQRAPIGGREVNQKQRKICFFLFIFPEKKDSAKRVLKLKL